jgi:hypothetical protein
MRRLDRKEVLSLFDGYLKSLEDQEVDDRVIISAQNLMEKIEDDDNEHPFSDPLYWGATVIVGSGWHLPAGAVVGGPLDGPELVLKQMEADDLVTRQEYRGAMRIARELAGSCDGVFRAHALVTLANAILMGTDVVSMESARRTARRMLLQAERIGRAEEDDPLLARIEELKRYLEV